MMGGRGIQSQFVNISFNRRGASKRSSDINILKCAFWTFWTGGAGGYLFMLFIYVFFGLTAIFLCLSLERWIPYSLIWRQQVLLQCILKKIQSWRISASVHVLKFKQNPRCTVTQASGDSLAPRSPFSRSLWQTARRCLPCHHVSIGKYLKRWKIISNLVKKYPYVFAKRCRC